VAEVGVRIGMQCFSWLTVLQLVVGTWFLLTLAPEVLKRFMGGDTLATVYLVVGVLLALATLVTGFRRQVLATVWLTVPLVYVMSFMRDSVRSGYLAPYFDPAKVPVTVQWSPLILFLISLIGGLALVIWMLMQLPAFAKSARQD